MLHNEVVCQVGTLLTLLDSVLAKMSAAAAAGDAGAAAGVERVFLFSLAWSIGGLLDSKDRAAFDAELRTQTSALPKRVRVCSRHAPARVYVLPNHHQSAQMMQTRLLCKADSPTISVLCIMIGRVMKAAGECCVAGRRRRHSVRVPGHRQPLWVAALA